MSKQKYEDRFASFMDRIFTDDAEARNEERALYIDVKVLDDADQFPGAYFGTGLWDKIKEQDEPVEEVCSRGRHTTRAIRRKQTFHARNRAKKVREICKTKERKEWGDFCRYPWKPIKKQVFKRNNKVRVEESDLLPYEDRTLIEIDVPSEMYYLNQKKWEQEYDEYANRMEIMEIIRDGIPACRFIDALCWR